MTMQNSTSDKPTSSDVARYRANYLSEQEGVYLYSKLAEAESDAHLAELYRRIARIEQRHSDLWKAQLTRAGETPPTYAQNWRIRTLLWIARHLGTGAVLSTVSSMEKNAITDYDTQPEAVLFAGLAGLLAGAFSMSIGEWVSVQSARELNQHQIAIESQELQDAPEEEQEELALIYQSKGLDEKTAKELAANLMQQSNTTLDTLAREELGIDPKDLGGSAWGAAITSFFLFAIGAIIPVFPFIFTNGLVAVGISLILSVIGLFGIGAGVSLTAGSPLWKAGAWQILLGLLAAGITFGLGKLIGSTIG